ncbi:hypothetical protein [Luteipulveratus halotolerans]|uniref:Uncharacterized protein n=1 Tax=Luteipulveratus halotolerans TaxID=1631356 RepID=A0A0L6CKW1_9MICO|nr:hypothetical protein [Luteipulveratus halotolerans]KNX38364.1 hypothetical protein VV01_16360 [Luteipulveratus halotolerans]
MLGEDGVERDIKVLGWRVDELEHQLGRMRVRSTAWTAVALLVLTLLVPQSRSAVQSRSSPPCCAATSTTERSPPGSSAYAA